MRIDELTEVDSTNLYLKRLREAGVREDVVAIAKRQTGGMGTKGRSFLSAEGGVYLSMLRFYRSFPAAEAFRIMMNSSVAVCKTVEEFGAKAEIKWPNDVFVAGRKICGILIENEVQAGNIRSSIVGIGVNVNNDVSPLRKIAVNLKEVVGEVSTEAVRDRLLRALQTDWAFADYKGYIAFLGREIFVTEGGREYFAVAKDVLPDGRLVLEEGGKTRSLTSGEIRIQLGDR